MEDQFYSRATGKLKKATHHAFGTQSAKSVAETYSIGDSTHTTRQYPTSKLSNTQKKFIESFLQGITQFSDIDIDPEVRAIHWIGMWLSKDKCTMVSCNISQPHISNGMVHLTNVTEADVVNHATTEFIKTSDGFPSIRTPHKNPQLCGKFAIPLADSLVSYDIINESYVTFSLVVFSQMRPIFIVSNGNGIYRCKLTYDSCRLMVEMHPVHVGVVGPTSRGQSYSFRSKSISGNGTAPCITIHRTGTLQYQGKPDSSFEVGKCFRECIEYILSSSIAARFISSLAIIDMPAP